MRLEEIKRLMPNVEYKQMVYQAKRKIEILFEGKYKDYQFYILNLGTHPTAYIEIPKTSKLFGKSYKEIYSMGIDIDVHGGLTYASKYLKDVKENSWFIGWDYAHAGDYVGYRMSYSKVFELSIDKKKWTTEEIFEDVVNCIEQIIGMEEITDETK